ncbi:MAG: hypothetical protein LHW56_10390 [Candidatus Cloacimonetes bacterium]|nr:hypothetical protein [Candidatus Cloacimonadota bacterium]MDY0173299.1 hypothetical protein [Candidatus Cloacimonadaceae bacterium]
MPYSERLPYAANAFPKGCFGRILRQPANAYRLAVLIYPFKLKENVSSSPRSLARHHLIHVLHDDRIARSSNSQKIGLGKSFVSLFNLQDFKDHCFASQQSHRHRKQFFPELTLKTIEIKLSRSPQCALNCAQEGSLPSHNYPNLANKYSKLKEYFE